MNAFLKFHLIFGVITVALILLSLATTDYSKPRDRSRVADVISVVINLLTTLWAAWLYFVKGGAL